MFLNLLSPQSEVHTVSLHNKVAWKSIIYSCRRYAFTLAMGMVDHVMHLYLYYSSGNSIGYRESLKTASWCPISKLLRAVLVASRNLSTPKFRCRSDGACEPWPAKACKMNGYFPTTCMIYMLRFSELHVIRFYGKCDSLSLPCKSWLQQSSWFQPLRNIT